MSNTEQVLTVLNGLNEEYEPVVAVISFKEILPLMQYVHPTLLAHEERIDHKKPLDSDLSIN